MPRLEHSPGTTGTYSHDGETWDIANGIIVVEDEDVAERLVAEDKKLSFVDENEDEEICGTVMQDGSTCDRPADECPYHSQ